MSTLLESFRSNYSATQDAEMSLDDYLAEMASHDGATAAGLAHHIAKDALGMTAAWGIDA